jgi:outer membrane lipoprotein-sorting protein
VKVIDENNEVFFYYIDTKTFYDIKLESKNGASYFSDYKLIDGILCSFKSRFVQNDNELMIEKRDVQFNPSIEDSFFDLKN